MAGRLRRFAQRDTSRIRNLQLPMASPRMLVIAVPEDYRLLATYERLAQQLASIARPHTWQMERVFEARFSARLRSQLLQRPDDISFVDIVDTVAPDAWSAGLDEVRVTFLYRVRPASFPEQFWHSNAALEIVIIPTSLGDAKHPLRYFIDTVPHVTAAAFFDKITS
jgi:hypothetical protein